MGKLYPPIQATFALAEVPPEWHYWDRHINGIAKATMVPKLAAPQPTTNHRHLNQHVRRLSAGRFLHAHISRRRQHSVFPTDITCNGLTAPADISRNLFTIQQAPSGAFL